MRSYSDYSHVGYGSRNSDQNYGAISISNSLVYTIQSNFTSNRGAIRYHDRNIDNAKSDPGAMVIHQCIFSNNTSTYGGSTVHMDSSASLDVQESVFSLLLCKWKWRTHTLQWKKRFSCT